MQATIRFFFRNNYESHAEKGKIINTNSFIFPNNNRMENHLFGIFIFLFCQSPLLLLQFLINFIFDFFIIAFSTFRKLFHFIPHLS